MKFSLIRVETVANSLEWDNDDSSVHFLFALAIHIKVNFIQMNERTRGRSAVQGNRPRLYLLLTAILLAAALVSSVCLAKRK